MKALQSSAIHTVKTYGVDGGCHWRVNAVTKHGVLTIGRVLQEFQMQFHRYLQFRVRVWKWMRFSVLAAAASIALPSWAEGPKNLEISITEATPVPAKLAAYEWRFLKAYGPDGLVLTTYDKPVDWPGELSVGFDEQGGMGFRACNSIFGQYTLEGESGIRLSKVMSTLMMCFIDPEARTTGESGDIMAWEERVQAKVKSLQGFKLALEPGATQRHLTLYFEDRSRWEFSGTPTLRTRYGDDREKLLYEIFADHKPCPDEGRASQRECMQVRQMKSHIRNANGDFDYAGPMQLLELNAFEGFTHKLGWHTLDYVSRYHLHHQAAGMPTTVDVYLGRLAPISAPSP